MGNVGKKSKKLPMGITIRNDRYRVRVRYRGISYDIGQFESLTIARLALERYQAEAILGTFISPAEQRRQIKRQRALDRAQQLTLGEWSSLWLESLTDGPNPRSDATIVSYKSAIRAHVLPAIGAGTPLASITAEDVHRMMEAAQKSGGGAANNVFTVFRAMMNSAVKTGAGGLVESPIPGDLRPPKRGRRTADQIPTIAEVRALEAAMDPKFSIAVPLSTWCQLRMGEVLGLQRGDFHGLGSDRPVLHVQRQWASKSSPPGYREPKDGSTRTVSIPIALVAKIQSHLDARVLPADDAPLLPSPRDSSRPVSHNALSARWNKARDKVHPGLGFHSLRHAGLTMFAQQGATQREIMERGGHRDVDAAMRYQHVASDRDRVLAERLSELIGE